MAGADSDLIDASKGLLAAFPLSRLESRLRYPRCGSRYVVVLYEPPRRD
jgi:hypothetical protein